MRSVLSVLFIIIGGTASAHPGHLADLAGHDHWLAGVAIGLAVLAGLWGVLKGEKDQDVVDEDVEEEAA
jgi:hypothetical protein